MKRKEKHKGIEDQQRRSKPEGIASLDNQRTYIDRVADEAIPTIEYQKFRRVKMCGCAASTADDVNRALNNDQRTENPEWNGRKTQAAYIEL